MRECAAAKGCACLELPLSLPTHQWSDQNSTEIRKPNTPEARTENHLLDILGQYSNHVSSLHGNIGNFGLDYFAFHRVSVFVFPGFAAEASFQDN